MSLTLLRIRPLDVLYLRGNRLFEGTGDGVAVMPPWPSLFAGALRSRMLADHEAIHAYTEERLTGDLAEVLGAGPRTQGQGSFRIVFVGLAHEGELLFPLPSDVVVFEKDKGHLELQRLRPEPLPAGVGCGSGSRVAFECAQGTPSQDGTRLRALALPKAPRVKVASGFFVTLAGIRAWQEGGVPEATHLRRTAELWKYDPRLGIGLDRERRSVQAGLLYTTRTVTLAPGVSFVVGVTGDKGLAPKDGLLRLGGDGRGASVEPFKLTDAWRPWEYVPQGSRFTVWLVTPGIFASGCLPDTKKNDGTPLFGSVQARLVAACVRGYDVVSGWDIAGRKPKTACRTVPSGSVYYYERVSGTDGTLSAPDPYGLGAFDGVQAHDLANEAATQGTCQKQSHRCVEGFGSFFFGTW